MSSILGSIISSGGGGGGTVDDAQLALKADLNYVNTQLSDKADLSLLTGVSVKIGFLAGSVNQANLATAVGEESGKENQQAGACAYGNSAGEFNQSSRSVAIGEVAGQNNLGEHSLAIGAEAGRDSQAPRSIVLNATGTVLNNTVENSCKIAPIRAQDVGSHILSYDDTTKEIVKSTISQVKTNIYTSPTLTGTVALPQTTTYNGTNLGDTLNGKANLSLLNSATVKIGEGAGAGQISQGAWAVAIGQNAGHDTQGENAVAMGRGSGQVSQGVNSVAIGINAGNSLQGDRAIAIGNLAGRDSQAPRSIVLNATGAVLNNTVQDSCKIAPIRAQDVGSHILSYDDTTKEIVKSTIAQVKTNIYTSPTLTGNVVLPQTTTYNGTNIGETLGLKANLASPTFSGNVALPQTTTYNGTNIGETLGLKANLASPTFSGNVVLPQTTTYNETNLGETLGLKANLASPTFSGNVALPQTTTYNGTNLGTLISAGGGGGSVEPPVDQFIEVRETIGTFGNYKPSVIETTTGIPPYVYDNTTSVFTFNRAISLNINTNFTFTESATGVFFNCDVEKNGVLIQRLVEGTTSAMFYNNGVLASQFNISFVENDTFQIRVYRTGGAEGEAGLSVGSQITFKGEFGYILTYDNLSGQVLKSTIAQVSSVVGLNSLMMTYNVFPKINLTSPFRCYGDSFNAPGTDYGPGMFIQLATLTGKTLINNAVSGSRFDYIATNTDTRPLLKELLTDTSLSTQTSLIAYGYNDLNSSLTLYSNTYAWAQTVLGSVLAMSLPQNKIVQASDASWTVSGTWVSQTGNISFRRNTIALNNYIEKDLGTVRYLAIQTAVIDNIVSNWEIQVNGVVQSTFTNNTTLTNTSFRCPAFVIDLCEDVANCVVRITNKSSNTTSSKWLDYVCGWTSADLVNAREVLITSIPRYNYDITDTSVKDNRRQQYNEIYEHVAKMCRHWGLPVSFYRLNEIQGVFWTDSFHSTSLQGKAWAKELIDHALIF